MDKIDSMDKGMAFMPGHDPYCMRWSQMSSDLNLYEADQNDEIPQ